MEKPDIDLGVNANEQVKDGGLAMAGKRMWIERLASYCIFVFALLLPVFFVPDLSFPFQFSKSIFLSVAALVVFTLWVIARLKDGEFVIPSSPILLALGVIVGIFALSGIFSGSLMSSIIGQGFEVGTAQ